MIHNLTLFASHSFFSFKSHRSLNSHLFSNLLYSQVNPLVRISASILDFICTVDQFSLLHGQHLIPNYFHLLFLPGLLLGLLAFMLILHYLPSIAYFPFIVRMIVLGIKSDYFTLPVSSYCTRTESVLSIFTKPYRICPFRLLFLPLSFLPATTARWFTKCQPCFFSWTGQKS